MRQGGFRALVADGGALVDRAADVATRHYNLLTIFGWALVGLWFVAAGVLKIALYRAGVSVGDVFLHANAYLNTALPGKLLYVASYQVERGITTLLQDHFEPTSLLLLPVYRLFDTPIFLLLLQGLGPLALVAGLVAVVRCFRGPHWLALLVALLALYNPTFTHAAIDAVGGYRHDAQFLLYLPAFIASFLLRRSVAAIVFLFLFLGVKQNAAFYGMSFGALTALLGLPFGDYRRRGLAVAILSAAYFALSVFVIPRWIDSPNTYVAWGASRIGGDMIGSAIHGFFSQKWYQCYLYFIYALRSLPFYFAGALDVGVLSVLDRTASNYYNFPVETFFAFGTLVTLLRAWVPEGGGWTSVSRERVRRPLVAVVVVQLAISVPWTGWMFAHIWTKSIEAAVRVPQADKEAAWRLVDPACGVSPHDALLDRFHRLPYWIRPQAAAAARYFVTVDPALLSPEALKRDPLTPFVANNRERLQVVGQAGVLTVWLDPSVPCRSWEK